MQRQLFTQTGRFARFVLLLAAASLTATVSLAQAPPEDPAGVPPEVMEEELDLSGLGASTDLGGENAIVVTTSAVFTAPAEGRPAEFYVTATMERGWHIYSITQAPGGPIKTEIKTKLPPGVRLAGPWQANPAPREAKEPAFDNLLVQTHEGTVTWQAPLEIDRGVDLNSLTIPGSVYAQPCEKACLMPQDYPFTATLGPAPAAEPAATAATERPFEIAADATLRGQSMLTAVGMGFLGGLILNLMPCVLPVIGLKIFSFVEQAGRSRLLALQLNIWYSLGLLAVFLLLGSLAVFAGYGWGRLFQFAGFNITLAAVIFVMALSFLGIWEVPLPGFIGSGKAGEWSQKEGATGAFFKGVLTTILATPCSAPFLAPALTWAVVQPPAKTFAVFGAAGIGMASPYLLIGAFPGLIRFLPKPGPWMETFKHILGFVLLGTVVFITTFMQWYYIVPTVALLFGLWAACSWIGKVPVTASPGKRAAAWLGAVGLALVVWVVAFPGIDDVIPGRFAFHGLAEVMQGRFEQMVLAAAPAAGDADGLRWKPFSRDEFDSLLADKKTVLVDFTADWCLTCKTLEAQVLHTPPIVAAIQQRGIVPLKADWTHGDAEVTKMLEQLGSKQVPVIALFPAGSPTRPIVLRGGYTQSTLLEAIARASEAKAEGA